MCKGEDIPTTTAEYKISLEYLPVLARHVHFNIPAAYWYQEFFQSGIGYEHEYSNPFEMDISAGFM
jgi:hypothetical protein